MKLPSSPWCFILHIDRDADIDEAWELLKDAGLNPLYIEEDPDELVKIYLDAPNESIESLLERFPFIDYADRKELNAIDWQKQWENHGLNFRDGYVHIDLPLAIVPQWKELKLTPGAGFGDLSHPTTRLVLHMMNEDVHGKDVIDIGCGSGVLALCAVALGARHVYAIDIDEVALQHSAENALLNEMNDQITFSLPENFSYSQQTKDIMILINMIMSEQKEAWESLASLHPIKGTCLASGILAEQKHEYIDWMTSFGWQLKEEHQEDGWIGLKFKRT